jgi:hypothetical protein
MGEGASAGAQAAEGEAPSGVKVGQGVRVGFTLDASGAVEVRKLQARRARARLTTAIRASRRSGSKPAWPSLGVSNFDCREAFFGSCDIDVVP